MVGCMGDVVDHFPLGTCWGFQNLGFELQLGPRRLQQKTRLELGSQGRSTLTCRVVA